MSDVTLTTGIETAEAFGLPIVVAEHTGIGMPALEAIGLHALGDLTELPFPAITYLADTQARQTAGSIIKVLIDGGLMASFASFYGPIEAITDTSTNVTLPIDTEWVDADNIAVIDTNKIEVTGDGWYFVNINVYLAAQGGVTPFDGRVVMVIGSNGNLVNKGYSSADGIVDDQLFITTLMELSAGNEFWVQIDNHLGVDIDAYVFEVTLMKLGE